MRCSSIILLALLASVMSCLPTGCASVKATQSTPLDVALGEMGGDLPVRRSELIQRCGLQTVPSQRSSGGMRGGWAAVREEWQLLDGRILVARFNIFRGPVVIVPDKPRADGTFVDFPVLNPEPQPSPTTWFNALTLLDRGGRVIADFSKLPAVKGRIP